MMVVPLFGLQYIVTIYRPMEIGCEWYDFYQIINNVIEGGTGAVVALIYCYTNSEVQCASLCGIQLLTGLTIPLGLKVLVYGFRKPNVLTLHSKSTLAHVLVTLGIIT